MLHLVPYAPRPLLSPESSSVYKQIRANFASGFKAEAENDALELRRSTRRYAVEEKDSDYEVDPDRAREALRQLDEQLQSLSKKQANPPKIRAMDLEQSFPGEKEEIGEIPESSLGWLAAGLLLFTVFYNILFITVIKPSIDGVEPVPSASMDEEAQGEQLRRSSRSAEYIFRP